MALFWVAIFFLDLFYYNRLLMGAVAGGSDPEDATKTGQRVPSNINLSGTIEDEFKKSFSEFPGRFLGVYLLWNRRE